MPPPSPASQFPGGLSFMPVPGMPELRAGDDLSQKLLDALHAAGLAPADGDILAVTQKIVSKTEGRTRRLAGLSPSPQAVALAQETRKDPRLVELILQESREVVRTRPDFIIAEHRLGIVLANAGIDRSNVAGGEDAVMLLPVDPDATAVRLRRTLEEALSVRLGVIITDSVGRAWRKGTVGIAIGASGVSAYRDLRGIRDLAGRPLQVSEIAPADSLAAAAVLVMGEAAEAIPAVLIRGAGGGTDDAGAAAVLRPRSEDLFR